MSFRSRYPWSPNPRVHLNFWRGQNQEAREERVMTNGNFSRMSPDTSRLHRHVWSKTGPNGESEPDIVYRLIPLHHSPEAPRALWPLYNRAVLDYYSDTSVRLVLLPAQNLQAG